MPLSKSDYMLYLRHPAWLWLKKFDKAKLPPVDDNLQATFDAGHEFEAYAEQLFPGAVRLGFANYDQYLSLPQRTADALQSGGETILQGRFEAGGLTCIVDVLRRVEEQTFDLIEIKSSTKPKPEHFYDLAFQKVTLEKAGLIIRQLAVVHVNNTYVRNGDIDPATLCTSTDVTAEVVALGEETERQIAGALRIASSRERPDFSPRFANALGVPYVDWASEWLEIYKSLHPELDPFSIYHLSYPTPVQIGQLEDAGYRQIAEVPEALALRPKQAIQIRVTWEDERQLDQEAIRTFLSTFTYPLYFLDYETFSGILPVFDGLSPYQDYPFQYSLHWLDSPDGELQHTEFLHAESSNPMPDLLQHMQTSIGESGTVLTWNMAYEKKCNDTMAGLFPEYSDFLARVNARIEDLMLPFSNLWLVYKGFYGSASIKKVLPVLVPELGYEELAVSDGLLARRRWMEAILQGKYAEQKQQILADLREYCTLDTFAMVRIFEVLRELVGLSNSVRKSPSMKEKPKQISMFE